MSVALGVEAFEFLAGALCPPMAADCSGPLKEVVSVLGALRDDDGFHSALQDPEVRRAVDHWLGGHRLPPEECEDWASEPRIMSVFTKLRQLQSYCQRAGTKVPLEAVLNRKTSFVLPDGRRVGDEPGQAGRGGGEPEPQPPESADLRCVHVDGVAYRKTPIFEDRDTERLGPQVGDLVKVEERRGDWARTEKGWVPLRHDGRTLFREPQESDLWDLDRPPVNWKRSLAMQFLVMAFVIFLSNFWGLEGLAPLADVPADAASAGAPAGHVRADL